MLVTEVVIAAPVILIRVVLRVWRIEIVIRFVLAPGNVRVGIKLDDGRRHRIPAIKGDDGAGELLPGRRRARPGQCRRVINVSAGGGLLREIASLFDVGAWHGRKETLADAPARALIAEKEEGPVLDDRAADGAAELILLEDRLFRARAIGEEVRRVEFIVAQELIE